MIPPSRDAILDGDAVLGLGVLQLLVDLLKLFLRRLECITGEAFVFSSVRGIFCTLCLENGFFLLEGEVGKGEGLYDR